MPVSIKGTNGGSVTLSAAAAANDTTLTLPNVTGTVLQSGTAVTAAQGGTGLTSVGTTGNVLTSNGTAWVSSAPASTGTSISNGTSNVTIGSSGGSITMTTAGASAATVDTSQNLQFNSGYGSVATAYGCRAWVNCNGTTASPSTIRGSGNVSSVTKNGTGDYTINFTAAMPDTNYCVSGNVMANYAPGGNMRCAVIYPNTTYSSAFAVGSIRILVQEYGGALADPLALTIAINR